VLTEVGHGTSLRISLPAGPAGATTGATGAVVCNPEEPQGFLVAENLPPLQPGQIYQVWLVQGDTLVNAGQFQPDSDGHGRVVFSAPLPMGQYSAMQITAEPAEGSSQPTGDPVISGALYAATY
jgi:hypothetical protein